MKITINGKSFEAKAGETLLDLCDRLEIEEIGWSCRSAACSTCLVEVQSGMENLSEMEEDEQDMIEEYAPKPNCRLACQAKILGPISVKYVGN
ncbi:MAG: 2Fe-2S iron-sulfur cluster-binding protein [Bdellovibrionota bacterium]